MLNRLLEFSVRQRTFVALATLVLVGIGIYSAWRFPIENEMAGLPGMMELRSLSKFGLSQVNLVFEDGTDIYRARQLVSERLQAVLEELPAGLTPRLAPISTGLGEIFYYVVEYQ